MLACLSPEYSLLLVAALWILFPISYISMEERSNINYSSSQPTSHKEIPYSPIESDSDDTPKSKLSCQEMLSLTWKTQVLLIALFVSIFCKQLLVSSVVTTTAFDNVSITPRNQFLIYMLTCGAGDLIGRPYIGFLSLFGIEEKFIVRKTWILAFVQVFILIFMVFVSWFRFLSHFHSAAVLVMANSMLSGMVFANTFNNTGEGLSVEERRFCRALLAGSLSLANLAVALIGLDTEARLLEHCLLLFPRVSCFTRSRTLWAPSTSCVL